MNLDPRLLRRWPVLAALDCFTHISETTIVALCAAHPLIESAHPRDLTCQRDQAADHLVSHLLSTLELVSNYHTLLEARDHEHHTGPDDWLF